MKPFAAAAFALFAIAALPACEPGGCAYGPTEIRDEAVDAVAGEAIDAFIAFPEGSEGVFTAATADEAPEGLEIAVQDDGVALSGAVAEAGTYAFTILVEAEEGNVCAEWARYDVVLTVE